ncbi:choice-of-anchor D domain-containing protein [Geobacter sp. AOG1]|uniref:choice-of-anchor D domain-containing protein n=1 Tax=Geobacter sp. AOG1 TaxID=1566346 RepID=UPI001CC47EAA|nr:choice-of-anchor D domain-containing protein [Geobacter sp. AOG1]GFE58608.1 hypothetical protein AOG1_24880 [Geobacter sp. AOG1]
MKKASLVFCCILALAAWMSWVPNANAFSGFYTTNCAGCHGATATCNGCHAHGVHTDSTKSDINVAGTTDKQTYAPGETVSVNITGGYRTGWIRAILYDQNMVELARSTGPAGIGGGPGYPITLTAPAPAAAGTYTWNVAWYGNQFDASGAFFGPRWTPDPNNPEHGQEIVSTNSFTVAVTPVPTPSIALNPASLNFGSILTGGSATLTTLVQNTGTADLSITAIALCTGTSTEFTWSPPAPFTVTPGSSQTLSVAYAPVDTGTDTGCLNITSNDPVTNPAVLNLTGSGVTTPPLTEFDFDIQKFMATKEIKLKEKGKANSVNFHLLLFNEGTGPGTSTATLVGMQNGNQVYSETINVSVPPAETVMFKFPPFRPTVLGDITWTVTVVDNDADVDQATAVTTVRQ